ncbi:hypothetical protein NMG60_11012076 [Bertholletia excelsa]
MHRDPPHGGSTAGPIPPLQLRPEEVLGNEALPTKVAPSLSPRKRPRMSLATVTPSESPLATEAAHWTGAGNRLMIAEKLDEWMRDSAAEIVKNLKQAPLLMQVFADKNGEANRLEAERAIADDWASVTRRWKNGETATPDGVILVEKLGDADAECTEDDGTKAWGIVIQGKGAKERGAACYLLKTSQVRSELEFGCTHFCLMKVQGFSQSALSELSNCWLLE